ncbi:hypothetical protein [Catenuloplanes japonicus]|uniref:hypothetical protein n=1 Tax=Catenuloplanes japonicus TaxID=33876 RepID=UPI0005250144|nr:hypothetical protein [Catenuloplanes japonicus]
MQGTNQAGTVIAERTYGTLTLSLTTAIDGFTVNARSGMNRHDELTKGFGAIPAARDYWGRVAYLAQAQMPASQIIEKLGQADGSYEWNAPAPAPVEPAATLADFAVDRGRQVPVRRSGAHTKPPTPATIRALLVALEHGRVWRAGRHNNKHITARRDSLDAAGSKLLLKLTPAPGTRRGDWLYGELTDAGRKLLAQLGHAAALAA